MRLQCLLPDALRSVPRLGLLIVLLIALLGISTGCLSESEDGSQREQPVEREEVRSDSQFSSSPPTSEADETPPESTQQDGPQEQQEQAQTVQTQDEVGQEDSEPSVAVATLEVYVVQPGDTLSRVAQQHNVTVNALLELNATEDPNTIRVGQELLIPSADGLGLCPNPDESVYLSDAQYIVDAITAATDVLVRRMDGATRAARGSGDWSGLVSTAVIDLSEAAESIDTLAPPQTASEIHERLELLRGVTEDAVGPTLNFIMSLTDDSAAAVPKLQALAAEASTVGQALQEFCADLGRVRTQVDDEATTMCPNAAEEAYFTALDEALGEMNDALLRLTVLTDRLGNDASLIRSSGWLFEVDVVSSSIDDAAYEIAQLEQPISVRYGVGTEAEWLAEDIDLAMGLYSLAIEYESADLMIEAGLEFVALEPRMLALGESITQFCD